MNNGSRRKTIKSWYTGCEVKKVLSKMENPSSEGIVPKDCPYF